MKQNAYYYYYITSLLSPDKVSTWQPFRGQSQLLFFERGSTLNRLVSKPPKPFFEKTTIYMLNVLSNLLGWN